MANQPIEVGMLVRIDGFENLSEITKEISKAMLAVEKATEKVMTFGFDPATLKKVKQIVDGMNNAFKDLNKLVNSISTITLEINDNSIQKLAQAIESTFVVALTRAGSKATAAAKSNAKRTAATPAPTPGGNAQRPPTPAGTALAQATSDVINIDNLMKAFNQKIHESLSLYLSFEDEIKASLKNTLGKNPIGGALLQQKELTSDLKRNAKQVRKAIRSYVADLEQEAVVINLQMKARKQEFPISGDKAAENARKAGNKASDGVDTARLKIIKKEIAAYDSQINHIEVRSRAIEDSDAAAKNLLATETRSSAIYAESVRTAKDFSKAQAGMFASGTEGAAQMREFLGHFKANAQKINHELRNVNKAVDLIETSINSTESAMDGFNKSVTRNKTAYTNAYNKLREAQDTGASSGMINTLRDRAQIAKDAWEQALKEVKANKLMIAVDKERIISLRERYSEMVQQGVINEELVTQARASLRVLEEEAKIIERIEKKTIALSFATKILTEKSKDFKALLADPNAKYIDSNIKGMKKYLAETERTTVSLKEQRAVLEQAKSVEMRELTSRKVDKRAGFANLETDEIDKRFEDLQRGIEVRYGKAFDKVEADLKELTTGVNAETAKQVEGALEIGTAYQKNMNHAKDLTNEVGDLNARMKKTFENAKDLKSIGALREVSKDAKDLRTGYGRLLPAMQKALRGMDAMVMAGTATDDTIAAMGKLEQSIDDIRAASNQLDASEIGADEKMLKDFDRLNAEMPTVSRNLSQLGNDFKKTYIALNETGSADAVKGYKRISTEIDNSSKTARDFISVIDKMRGQGVDTSGVADDRYKQAKEDLKELKKLEATRDNGADRLRLAEAANDARSEAVTREIKLGKQVQGTTEDIKRLDQSMQLLSTYDFMNKEQVDHAKAILAESRKKKMVMVEQLAINKANFESEKAAASIFVRSPKNALGDMSIDDRTKQQRIEKQKLIDKYERMNDAIFKNMAAHDEMTQNNMANIIRMERAAEAQQQMPRLEDQTSKVSIAFRVLGSQIKALESVDVKAFSSDELAVYAQALKRANTESAALAIKSEKLDAELQLIGLDTPETTAAVAALRTQLASVASGGVSVTSQSIIEADKIATDVGKVRNKLEEAKLAIKDLSSSQAPINILSDKSISDAKNLLAKLQALKKAENELRMAAEARFQESTRKNQVAFIGRTGEYEGKTDTEAKDLFDVSTSKIDAAFASSRKEIKAIADELFALQKSNPFGEVLEDVVLVGDRFKKLGSGVTNVTLDVKSLKTSLSQISTASAVADTVDDMLLVARATDNARASHKKLSNEINKLEADLLSLGTSNKGARKTIQDQVATLKVQRAELAAVGRELTSLAAGGLPPSVRKSFEGASDSIADMRSKLAFMSAEQKLANTNLKKGGDYALAAAQDMKRVGSSAKSASEEARRLVTAYQLMIQSGTKLNATQQQELKSAHALASAFRRMAVNVDKSSQAFKIIEDRAKRAGKGFKLYSAELADSIRHNFKFIQAMSIVTSVLFGLRTAMMALIEESKTMGRIMTVMRSDSLDFAESYVKVSNEVRNAAIEFGTTFEETGEIVKQLGSAGFTLEESLSALIPTLKLVTATAANAEESARAVAGIYRVFGDQIRQTTSEVGAFVQINDVLSSVYRNHQVELDELVQGFRFSSAAASVAGFSFQETAGFLAVLNDNMIKSGAAGRGLQVVMAQTAKKADQIEKALGVTIDKSKPLKSQFLSVLQQVNKSLGSGVIKMSEVEKQFKLFGLRGARTFITLATKFEDVEKAFDELGDKAKGTSDDLSRIVKGELASQFQQAKQALLDFVREGLIPLKDIVVLVVDTIKGLRDAFVWIPDSVLAAGAALMAISAIIVIVTQSMTAIAQVVTIAATDIVAAFSRGKAATTAWAYSGLSLVKSQTAVTQSLLTTSAAMDTNSSAALKSTIPKQVLVLTNEELAISSGHAAASVNTQSAAMDKGAMSAATFGGAMGLLAIAMIGVAVVAVMVHESSREILRDIGKMSGELRGIRKEIEKTSEAIKVVDQLSNSYHNLGANGEVVASQLKDGLSSFGMDLEVTRDLAVSSNAEIAKSFDSISDSILVLAKRELELRKIRQEKQAESKNKAIKKALETNGFSNLEEGMELGFLDRNTKILRKKYEKVANERKGLAGELDHILIKAGFAELLPQIAERNLDAADIYISSEKNFLNKLEKSGQLGEAVLKELEVYSEVGGTEEDFLVKVVPKLAVKTGVSGDKDAVKQLEKWVAKFLKAQKDKSTANVQVLVTPDFEIHEETAVNFSDFINDLKGPMDGSAFNTTIEGIREIEDNVTSAEKAILKMQGALNIETNVKTGAKELMFSETRTPVDKKTREYINSKLDVKDIRDTIGSLYTSGDKEAFQNVASELDFISDKSVAAKMSLESMMNAVAEGMVSSMEPMEAMKQFARQVAISSTDATGDLQKQKKIYNSILKSFSSKITIRGLNELREHWASISDNIKSAVFSQNELNDVYKLWNKSSQLSQQIKGEEDVAKTSELRNTLDLANEKIADIKKLEKTGSEIKPEEKTEAQKQRKLARDIYTERQQLYADRAAVRKQSSILLQKRRHELEREIIAVGHVGKLYKSQTESFREKFILSSRQVKHTISEMKNSRVLVKNDKASLAASKQIVSFIIKRLEQREELLQTFREERDLRFEAIAEIDTILYTEESLLTSKSKFVALQVKLNNIQEEYSKLLTSDSYTTRESIDAINTRNNTLKEMIPIYGEMIEIAEEIDKRLKNTDALDRRLEILKKILATRKEIEDSYKDPLDAQIDISFKKSPVLVAGELAKQTGLSLREVLNNPEFAKTRYIEALREGRATVIQSIPGIREMADSFDVAATNSRKIEKSIAALAERKRELARSKFLTLLDKGKLKEAEEALKEFESLTADQYASRPHQLIKGMEEALAMNDILEQKFKDHTDELKIALKIDDNGVEAYIDRIRDRLQEIRDLLSSQNDLTGGDKIFEGLGEYVAAFGGSQKAMEQQIIALRTIDSEISELTRLILPLIKSMELNIGDPVKALVARLGRSGFGSDVAGKSFEDIAVPKASGGLIPGVGHRDSVPAMLMPGEFVIPKRVVQMYGQGFFELLRAGLIPGLEDGRTGGGTVNVNQSTGVDEATTDASFGVLKSLLGLAVDWRAEAKKASLEMLKNTKENFKKTRKTKEEQIKIAKENRETAKAVLDNDVKMSTRFSLLEVLVPAIAKISDDSKKSMEKALKSFDIKKRDESLKGSAKAGQEIGKTQDEVMKKELDVFKKAISTSDLLRAETYKAAGIAFENNHKILNSIIDEMGVLFDLIHTEYGKFLSGFFIPEFAADNVEVLNQYRDQLKEIAKAYDESVGSAITALQRNESGYYDYLNKLQDAEKARIDAQITAEETYRDNLIQAVDVFEKSVKGSLGSIVAGVGAGLKNVLKLVESTLFTGSVGDRLKAEFEALSETGMWISDLPLRDYFAKSEGSGSVLEDGETNTEFQKDLAGIGRWFKDAGEGIKDFWKNGSDVEFEFDWDIDWKSVWSSVKDGAADAAHGVWEFAKSVGQISLQVSSMAIDGLVAGFQGLLSLTSGENNGADMVRYIEDFAKDLPKMAPEFVDALVDNADLILAAIAENAPAVVQTMVEELPRLLEGLASSLEEHLPKIIESIAEGLPDLIRGLVPVLMNVVKILIDQLPAIMGAVAESLPILMFAILKELPSLIVNIVKNMALAIVEAVKGAISGIGSGIADWAKGGFGIFHDGGVIGKGYNAAGEQLILAQSGEGVLSREGLAALGGVEMLNKLNAGKPLFNPSAQRRITFHNGGVVGDRRSAFDLGNSSSSYGANNMTTNNTINVTPDIKGDETDEQIIERAALWAQEIDYHLAKMSQDRDSKFARTLR